MICAVGLEYRDYPTLIEAVHGLPVQAFGSCQPMVEKRDTTADSQIPDNVLVVASRSTSCVTCMLPVSSCNAALPGRFPSGVTAILEAMAMEKL